MSGEEFPSVVAFLTGTNIRGLNKGEWMKRKATEREKKNESFEEEDERV